MASLGEYDCWNSARQSLSVSKDIVIGEESGGLYLLHGLNSHIFPYEHRMVSTDNTCVRKLYCAGKCPPYFDAELGKVSTTCPWKGVATASSSKNISSLCVGNQAVNLDSHFPLKYSISSMQEVSVDPIRPLTSGEWYRCDGHMHVVDHLTVPLASQLMESIEPELRTLGKQIKTPDIASQAVENILRRSPFAAETVDRALVNKFLARNADILLSRLPPLVDLLSDSDESLIDLTEEQPDVVILDSGDEAASVTPSPPSSPIVPAARPVADTPAVRPPRAVTFQPPRSADCSAEPSTASSIMKMDFESRTKQEDLSAQSIEEDRRAAALREDLTASHSAKDFKRCVAILQELLTFSPRFLRKPWASFMRTWDGYYITIDVSLKVLYGLRELLVTASREIFNWPLFNSTCSAILDDDCAPPSLVMQTVAYQLNHCMGNIYDVARMLKSLEANPRFRQARDKGCGFSDAALARAYYEVELVLPAHKHAVRALTDSLEADEKFWCLLISLYCQPQVKSLLSTRQQITRWRDFLRDVSMNTELAFDHYLNWLLAVEPNCATKHEYAAVIVELKWLTSDRSVDSRSQSYLKAVKRIKAFKCQGDSSWLERSVDATRVGNEARYANHSDDPNCCLDSTPAIVALKPIASGDEITVNYGPEYWRWLPSSADDEELDSGECSYTGSIVEEPPFGLDHEFAVRNRSVQGNAYFKVEVCPRSHPAYPGKRLLACRDFAAGETVIIYAGVRSSRPEIFSMLCSSMHTARTDSGVVRGAFGFILHPSKTSYLPEQNELPVFACLLSNSAGDLRDWNLLPDLKSIKDINDLGVEATAVLIQMLMSKKAVATLQNWIKSECARSELKMKLLRYGTNHRDVPPKLALITPKADEDENMFEDNKSKKRK